jgi:RNA recognition motif-containing protein
MAPQGQFPSQGQFQPQQMMMQQQ